MALIIDEGMAGPDDPIYTNGLRIHSIRRIPEGGSSAGVTPMVATKKCPNCKKTFPVESFNKCATQKDGLSYQCKKCQNAYYVGWHRAQKDGLEFQCHEIIRKKRAYCRKKKLLFQLDKEWLKAKMLQTHCEVTGIEFEDDKYGPFGRSLDRIHPDKGYTKENTRVVARVYNLAKNDWSESVVLRMALALVDREEIEKKVSESGSQTHTSCTTSVVQLRNAQKRSTEKDPK